VKESLRLPVEPGLSLESNYLIIKALKKTSEYVNLLFFLVLQLFS
jgi:hypothetical protein